MWKPRKLKKLCNGKTIRRDLKRLQSESGFVLVAIVILTIIMAILAVGIMSLNVNQALSSQHQVERIRAEELAKGAFWFNFASLRDSGAGGIPSPATITAEGKEYTISRSTPPGVGPNDTQAQQINVLWQP